VTVGLTSAKLLPTWMVRMVILILVILMVILMLQLQESKIS
jgi:hypothetical protein